MPELGWVVAAVAIFILNWFIWITVHPFTLVEADERLARGWTYVHWGLWTLMVGCMVLAWWP